MAFTETVGSQTSAFPGAVMTPSVQSEALDPASEDPTVAEGRDFNLLQAEVAALQAAAGASARGRVKLSGSSADIAAMVIRNPHDGDRLALAATTIAMTGSTDNVVYVNLSVDPPVFAVSAASSFPAGALPLATWDGTAGEVTDARVDVDPAILPAASTPDADAVHVDEAGEITAITAKSPLVGADTFLVEDSADSDAKKSATIADIRITESQITDLDHTDADAIHDNVAGEIAALTAKSPLIGADLLLVEDSAASNAKKKATVADLRITESQITDLDHTDGDAIHDNVSGEIAALTAKATLVAGDLLLIEDSAASNAKKKALVSALRITESQITDLTAALSRAPDVILRDEQTSGTHGGTFTSGAWRTRVLNTESRDVDGDCTLASNQFTLSAGDWFIVARAPANRCERHKAKLRNVTGASDLVIGSSLFSWSSGVQGNSWVSGVFTVAASQALEIQHQCSSTRATDGFGNASSFSVAEVYTEVWLWKV